MRLIQLQVKMNKTAEINYLEANKQHILRFGSWNKGTVDVLKAKQQRERLVKSF